MEQPLVSILMTAYNREKYIAAAIESVLASTFQNYELIVVDDGSRDKTVEIARSIAQRDKRIKVYVNEKNLGDYPNRNKAASYATGKYLKYLDADDFIYPWGLSLLVQMMEQFPDAGWGLCSLDQQRASPYPIQLLPRETYRHHYSGAGIFNKAPTSSIIKTESFRAVGGFPEKRMTSDFEMWHILGARYPLLLMPKGIVWYREHENQEMNSIKQFAETYEQITLKYLSDAGCPLEKDFIERYKAKRKKLLFSKSVKAFIKLNWKDSLDTLRLSRLYN